MANDDSVTIAPDPVATGGTLDDRLRDIAGKTGQIRFLGSGDRAALRRIPLTGAREADGVVVKLLCHGHVSDWSIEHDFDRWRTIVHVAALLSGTGADQAHDRSRSLGCALQEANYSENRLLRLLGTRGEALTDQVHRAARILATKGKPVDLRAFFHLLGDDEAQAEAARVRIAKDFYTAEARSK